jgi:hypothetical protein
MTVEPDGSITITSALVDNVTTDGGPRLAPEGTTVEWQVEGGEPTRVEAQFLGGDLFRAVLPPQAEEADLKVRAGAVDQADNELQTPSSRPLLSIRIVSTGRRPL